MGILDFFRGGGGYDTAQTGVHAVSKKSLYVEEAALFASILRF